MRLILTFRLPCGNSIVQLLAGGECLMDAQQAVSFMDALWQVCSAMLWVFYAIMLAELPVAVFAFAVSRYMYTVLRWVDSTSLRVGTWRSMLRSWIWYWNDPARGAPYRGSVCMLLAVIWNTLLVTLWLTHIT